MANPKDAFGFLVSYSLGWTSADPATSLFSVPVGYRRRSSFILRRSNPKILGKRSRIDWSVLSRLDLDDSLRACDGILYLYDFGPSNNSRAGPIVWRASTNISPCSGLGGIHSSVGCGSEIQFPSTFQVVPGALSSTSLRASVPDLYSYVVV